MGFNSWTFHFWVMAIIYYHGIIYNNTDSFRIGTFYPDSDSITNPFDPLVDCSNFWRDKKIKINPMNFTSEEYMDNIQTSAYVGMGLNVAVVIAYLISFRSRINDESGCCSKFKLIMKIIYAFFWPVADSISGIINGTKSFKLKVFKFFEPTKLIQMLSTLANLNQKIFWSMSILQLSKQWHPSFSLLYSRIFWSEHICICSTKESE